MKKVEQSLVIIKPDGAVRRHVSAVVLKTLLDQGLRVRAFKEMSVPRSLAEKHYAVHKERPFFPWIVDFLSSAPVLVMILEGENAIEKIRNALGKTFVQDADPASLRGKYGIWKGVNIAHASDAPETAKNEIALWASDGGLAESDDAQALAEQYIEQYIKNDIDMTMEIRKTVVDAIENNNTSEDTITVLAELLSKDSNGIDKSDIRTLARVIYDFILEEITNKNK